MIIAINTRQAKGNDNFFVECFSDIAKKHPQHQFIFIFDALYDEKLITSKNITVIVSGPKVSSPLRWLYRYNYKIPALLKKYNADIFVSVDGICSLRTKLPQCLLLHDLSYLYCSEFLIKSHARFFNRYTPKFLEKAKVIATHSAFSKIAIAKHYKIDEQKIYIIPEAVSGLFQPMGPEEKEKVRNEYSDGKEYFLFTGDLSPRDNPMNLLKAFSFFKKRQKSNMKLLILVTQASNDASFTTGLKSFKFRDEVKLLRYLSNGELARITAAAYAFVYPVLFQDLALRTLEAIQCEVPVIAANSTAFRELFGEAVLYANPNDFNDIADKMMTLFKDEQKRMKLITVGKQQPKGFSIEKTADLLWQFISHAIERETT